MVSDNGRHVIIEQNGIEVEGNYFSERFCDPDVGPVDEPTPGADSTFFDFRGTPGAVTREVVV